MLRMEKLKDNLQDDLRRRTEDFEQAKSDFIKFITQATAKEITELDRYTTHTKITDYAKDIEEIRAKLRVIDYLENGDS